MERTPISDTAYEDDSNNSQPDEPQFTAATEQTARQVVPLRQSNFLDWFRRRLSLRDMETQGGRLLAAFITFAIAGGLVGGLVAAVDGDQNRQINPASSTSGAASLLDNMEAEGGAVGLETERSVVEMPKRRSHAQVRKAYLFANLDSDSDFENKEDENKEEKKDENKDERERKRERKQKYWDDIDQ